MKRGREEEELDENDMKRFFKACKDGDVKQVQDFILRRGIDVNCRGTLQMTALHT